MRQYPKIVRLKVHLPYHESDHVLSMAYNILAGGQRLEDMELLRQDAAFLDALGASRIPDPTTAGDFTRRFDAKDIERLMDAINEGRERVWRCQEKGWMAEAFIEMDGTMAPTLGACKGGKVDFVFGMDACKGLVPRAEALPKSAWNPLKRPQNTRSRPSHASGRRTSRSRSWWRASSRT